MQQCFSFAFLWLIVLGLFLVALRFRIGYEVVFVYLGLVVVRFESSETILCVLHLSLCVFALTLERKFITLERSFILLRADPGLSRLSVGLPTLSASGQETLCLLTPGRDCALAWACCFVLSVIVCAWAYALLRLSALHLCLFCFNSPRRKSLR